MRLDHLLSREPICGEQLVCLPVVVGVLVVFLCLHEFAARCGWWVWVRYWVGHKKFYERAHCRVHVQHRVSVRCLLVVVAHTASLRVFLGVGCVWWVVCDLYSGCEHICSVLFFVFCLVLLGIRWMPWHQELMKDVAACDMPRGAGERALLSEGVRMGEPNLGCAGLPSSERV